MQKDKKYYQSLFNKICMQNAKLFNGYSYTYTGSLVLFLSIPHWDKIPEDIDIAVDWNGKGIDELIDFYHKLNKNSHVKNISVKTIFGLQYTTRNKTTNILKGENIDLDSDKHELLEFLLNIGNIKISYNLHKMSIELFPEKNGNGLTNLGFMKKELNQVSVSDGKTKELIPLLDYQAIAQGYAMNFLKEIIHNNIYRFTEQNNKVKDGIRLFSIISLLEKQGKDASPNAVLQFIESTVIEYKKIPKGNRSKYIHSAIQEFPWIKKMMKEIISEYQTIIKNKNSKKYQFNDFYKTLGNYKKELNQYVDYLQKDMLTILKNDILGKKYNMIDTVRSFSKEKTIYKSSELKKIAKNLTKINKQIENIGIKNKNESFVYFYEMYMLKNLFIKPMNNIL